MIEVDLRTRIINQDQSIFFARPGTEYRLYIDVIEQNTILVDLPALDLDAGTSIDKQVDLNRKIHRSRALKAWHRGRRKAKEPSRDLNDYSNSLEDAGTTQIRSVLFGFFERAKIGDLALVTPKSYNDLAYVGEIVSAQNVFTKVDGVPLYGTDAVYGRAVRWLAKTEKKFLDREIINITHKPNAFVILPKSSYINFYKLAYPSYSYSNIFRSKFNVEKDDFKAFDDLIIQSFFNFIAVNTRVLAENALNTDIRKIGETNFIDARSYSPQLQVEISSPGFLSLTAERLTPLVAAALFAIAVSVPPHEAVKAAENNMIRIGNSSSPASDPCVAEVQRLAIKQIQLLGLDGWPEACKKALEVQERIGLVGPASVKP